MSPAPRVTSATRAFDWSIAPLDGLQGEQAGSLAARVQSYLSPQHRDSPGEGCPAAALAVDVARAGGDLSAVFAEGVERNIGRFARVIGTLGDDQAPDAAQRAQAMAMLSSMVGALVLAQVGLYRFQDLVGQGWIGGDRGTCQDQGAHHAAGRR